ncbi:MAG: DUF445 family protein [Syntrophomonadaceae bacterium]|jgi:uncharacterized membrane protein YheB (UPF0754 family)|nr:DUF445 family protein [Syntrophomonadaceae bacterium]
MERWVIIPLTCAVIGYLTNVVAVRMLFWPREAHHFLGFNFQGLLPKRQKELAASIGKLIEEQLLSADDIYETFSDPAVKEKITGGLVSLLRCRIDKMLPKVLANSLGKIWGDSIEKILKQETEKMLGQILDRGREYIETEHPISGMIEKKIAESELGALEDLVISASSREIKFIEIIGGVLGLVIGLIQVLFLGLWSH